MKVKNLFQFLIGRLKTLLKQTTLNTILQVSIPHRQAKNRNHPSLSLFPCQFQFLIGRLKTKLRTGSPDKKKNVSIPHRQAKNDNELKQFAVLQGFQFLIGRLKTNYYCAVALLNKEFQFLIGRLKTKNRVYNQRILPCFNSSQVG